MTAKRSLGRIHQKKIYGKCAFKCMLLYLLTLSKKEKNQTGGTVLFQLYIVPLVLL